MIERAVAAGVRFSWVTADEAYGDNGPLRGYLEQDEIPYVLAVVRDHMVAAPTGRAAPRDIPAAAGVWHRLSSGSGAKGRRWYDWALFATTRLGISLLVRLPGQLPMNSRTDFSSCDTFPQIRAQVRALRGPGADATEPGAHRAVPQQVHVIDAGRPACVTATRPTCHTKFRSSNDALRLRQDYATSALV